MQPRYGGAARTVLRGQPLADIAVDLGFADQTHLTRRFKRFLGTMPGRFAQG